jgi:hypothetical protein
MKAWLVYGLYLMLAAGISGMITAYLRFNDPPPHPHNHALAEDSISGSDADLGELTITVLREDGAMDTITFPSDSHITTIGNALWIGMEGDNGDVYENFVAGPGDEIIAVSTEKSIEAVGPTAIPEAPQPPEGPGPEPPPPKFDDVAELAEYFESIGVGVD